MTSRTGAVPGVVFDLDNTLVDSECLSADRTARNWRRCRQRLVETRVFHSVYDVLGHLARHGVPIAVVTNSPSNYAEALMQHHGIECSVRVCYHDTPKRKPNPEPIFAAMYQAGMARDGTIGVGDTVGDQQAYASAGILSVGAGWSPYLDGTAEWDTVLNDPRQLLGLL